MMTLIAAAIAAAAPTAPAQMPSDAHKQHQQSQMADMKDCCCKDMMDKMHSDMKMDGMQDYQEHNAH
jgi:hypothetical protein